MTTQLADIASILNKTSDVVKLQNIADIVKQAFNAKFLNPVTGRYQNGTQSEQVYPLYFNLVPEDMLDRVSNSLFQSIHEQEDHLITGILGTKFSLEYLSDTQPELAYQIVNQKTPPSWGYMLQLGATTIWENWLYNETTSHNQPMFGSYAGWFYRYLGGIKPGPNAVAWDYIIIDPKVIGDLTWVNTSLETIKGVITSNWKIESNGDLYLEFDVPVNSRATLVIPQGKNKNPQKYDVGSGHYNFTVPGFAHL